MVTGIMTDSGMQTFTDLKDGAILYTHSDHIGRKIQQTRDSYERDLLNELSRRMKKSGTFLDIGANIGNHSVYFARYLADKVISIEPNGNNFALLERNAADLPIIAICGACSDVAGMGHVQDVSHNMGMCELEPGNTVHVFRADALITEPVRLIKIDAEKSTGNALRGCEKLIYQYRPIIVIEGRSEWLESKGYWKIWSGCATETFVYVF